MNNKIKLLANTNSRDTIFRKTKEECAELIIAISHFEEFGTTDRVTQSTDVFKEIADVEIMCQQLKVELHGIEAVEKYKEEKIERQLKRFRLAGNVK